MASITAERHSPRSWIALVVFLAIVIGVGGLIGTQSTPDGWYQALTKPPLNPPNWVFGPVWFTLYVLIAIAGWRVSSANAACKWRMASSRRRASISRPTRVWRAPS